MNVHLQLRPATAFWPRLWDRLLMLEHALSTTPADIADRRITRLESELAAVREEVAFLRAQGTRGGSVGERG